MWNKISVVDRRFNGVCTVVSGEHCAVRRRVDTCRKLQLQASRLCLGLAVWVLVPTPGAAQTCPTVNGIYSCTVPAGTYGSGQSFSPPYAGQQIDVTSAGTFTVPSSSGLALQIISEGLRGNIGVGEDTGAMTVVNTGAITLTPSGVPSNETIYGILGLLFGGEGYSGGGSTASLGITNSAAITLVLPNVGSILSGDVLVAASLGGNTLGNTDNAGGPGGASGGASIINSGLITATVGGSSGFGGIEAIATGGAGQNTGGAAGTGGNSNAATVSNSAPVNVTWSWANAGSTNYGLYGILAQSVAGAGATTTGISANAGGIGTQAQAVLGKGGNVDVMEDGNAPSNSPISPSAGVSAAVLGGNGGSTTGADNINAGGGGNAYSATITVTDADVTTAGNQLPALLALAQGGAGGLAGCTNCNPIDTHSENNGGSGGSVYGGSAISITAATQALTITTLGSNSPAVAAIVQGGAGGTGGMDSAVADSSSFGGGNGGYGGYASMGSATVSLAGAAQTPVHLTTLGSTSPGVSAVSSGGTGAAGGLFGVDLGGGSGGSGGSGGPAGEAMVSLTATSIRTLGGSSPAIAALSAGGAAGAGGYGNGGHSNGGNGGVGGSGGLVMVTLDDISSIVTQGPMSSGIVVQSTGGAGGVGGDASDIFTGNPGSGGAGGAGGNVTVTNGGTILTAGSFSRGILAQSMPGAGGEGGVGNATVGSEGGGNGAASGLAGTISVTNDGSITTSGVAGEAILAQSIGGTGGAGGQGGGLFGGVGGNGSNNIAAASGGSVQVDLGSGQSAASITTTGLAGIGVLAQSIGGGGGDGGGASGAVAIGGSGGGGGDGGSVNVAGNPLSTIITEGAVAYGIGAQSIGGGGGNGGIAASVAPFAALAIGGSGGNGGAGGSSSVNLTASSITTSGFLANGVLVQSVGGGGGSGGAALAESAGAAFAISESFGGSGGAGGSAGTAEATLTDSTVATGQNPLLLKGNGGSSGTCTALPCNQLPVDAVGVAVQSLGGGGGSGGSALAQALAIAVPVTPDGNQVAIAFADAVGGSGGTGGSGGAAQLALSNGSTIVTSGQGSHGALVQSIGGGGGSGGDSSALAAAVGYGDAPGSSAQSVAITATYTVGGTGGSGGNGGAVTVALGGTIANGAAAPDAAGSAPTGIETFGDFSDGLMVQSIGGGGGNAGFGSGNTQTFGTGDTSASLNVTLGSSGGSGGSGGSVVVDLFPGQGITTFGSGSIGLLAQSIGGGGGASQGGSISAGVGISAGHAQINPTVTVDLGGNSGSPGGAGGSASVVVEAPITTHGGDATGVLLQSIGGGGGIGGSAGSDASADNPILEAISARELQSDIEQQLQGNFGTAYIDPTLSIAVGGKGGTGGAGGAATVNFDAQVTTSGDWADGIVAQSIGGGGGKGGTAVATGTGGVAQVTVNYDISVGGTGGGGGYGGSVLVNLNQGGNMIHTAGFGATGVIAQSIGGGGGIGADGSDSATGLISAGNQTGGNGGTGGDGGNASVLYYNPDHTTIATGGAAADGVVVQSIGNGGGIAGAGSSLFVSAFKFAGKTVALSAGSDGSAGFGQTATFGPQNGTNTPLSILTTGNDSFGVLVQSVGGGGGLVTSQQSAGSYAVVLGSRSDGLSNGGPVMVDLASASTITTLGTAAHGVVAQSIGGGGGVIRLVDAAGDTPMLTTSASAANLQPQGSEGDGGPVTIEAEGSIRVAGPSSIGILAQSVGSGGGLVLDGNTMYAGSPDAGATTQNVLGKGDVVSVTADGPVAALGTNGIGIFAQSTGYSSIYGSGGSAVTVNISGSVTGGSGVGASAVQIDTPPKVSGNEVTVNAGGSLQTLSGALGTAILVSGGGSANVSNQGTITGSTDLGEGGTLTNRGTFNPGPSVQGTLVNLGTVVIGHGSTAPVPGGFGFITTTITGDFVQGSSGTVRLGVDFNTGTSDTLVVNGRAVLGGSIQVQPTSLLPVPVTVITADGGITGHLAGASSTLFAYDVRRSDNSYTVTPRALGFDPAGLDVSRAGAEVAAYLDPLFEQATPGQVGVLFADLNQLAGAGGRLYAHALDQLHPGTMLAFASQRLAETQAFAGGLFDCADFAGVGAVLNEHGCAYLSTFGRLTHQFTDNGYQGFRLESASWQAGAQTEFSPGWLASGAVAFDEGWLSGDGNASGKSQTGYFGVAITREIGPWQMGLATFGSFGNTKTTRTLGFAGISSTLSASPEIASVGGRTQLAYTATFGGFYARPALDLDLIDVRAGSAAEGGVLEAQLNARSQTTFAATPLVELGMRGALGPITTMRSFLALGVSSPTNSRWQQPVQFNAARQVGDFTVSLPMAGTSGVVKAGVQLARASRFTLQASYDGMFSDRVVSNAVTFDAQYKF